MSSPSRGTHFGDGVRVGPQQASGYDNALPGAPVSPLFVYDIVPQPASFTNVAALQTLAGAGYVTLVNSGNSGTNTVVIKNNQPFIQFDCPRRIQVRGVGGTTLATLSVYGEYDEGKDQSQLQTEQFNGPVGARTVTSQKTYTGIYRIYSSAGTTANISIGCADAFDIPYLARDPNYVIPYYSGNQDNTIMPALGSYGNATLGAGGTVVEPVLAIKANSLIFASNQTQSTPGNISVPQASIIPGTSFVINSDNAADRSVINFEVIDPSSIAGTATLIGAAGPSSEVVVVNENFTTSDFVQLTRNTPAGTLGALSYTATVNGSFIIESSNAADRSSVNWRIIKASEYSGTALLAAGGPPSTVTVPNFILTAQSRIFLSYAIVGGTPGFLYSGAITPGTSFVIDSTSATDTSFVTWHVVNPVTVGSYILPDSTSPALISSGNPRGVYLPSQPADGFSRLTAYIYNRGIVNAAATVGANPTDTTQQNTLANLYGVPPYSDTNH